MLFKKDQGLSRLYYTDPEKTFRVSIVFIIYVIGSPIYLHLDKC